MIAPKGLVRLAAVGQLLLVLLGVGIWRLDTAAQYVPDPSQRPVLDESVPRPLNIESALNLATARALDWSSTPRLVSARMIVEWPDDLDTSAPDALPPDGTIVYLFAGGTDEPDHTFGVVIDRAGGTFVREHVSKWEDPPEVPPGRTIDYPVASIDALRAADSLIGRSFRQACPEFRRQARVALVQNPDGSAFWRVIYRDQRADVENSLEIDISTETVAVLNMVRRNVPC